MQNLGKVRIFLIQNCRLFDGLMGKLLSFRIWQNVSIVKMTSFDKVHCIKIEPARSYNYVCADEINKLMSAILTLTI